jgi:hypothetical protein
LSPVVEIVLRLAAIFAVVVIMGLARFLFTLVVSRILKVEAQLAMPRWLAISVGVAIAVLVALTYFYGWKSAAFAVLAGTILGVIPSLIVLIALKMM